MSRRHSYYEFFAGGGMARLGLGSNWQCSFANDMDPLKGAVYEANFGAGHFDSNDIWDVEIDDLADSADLAWASFPCQDLSLAGNGLGIGNGQLDEATRSGALWPFLNIVAGLKRKSSQPKILVLENVTGLLTVNGGKDFALIMSELRKLGYSAGALVLDARHFVPQSRPRVFIVGLRDDLVPPVQCIANAPISFCHNPMLLRAHASLSEPDKNNWRWWNLPVPPITASTQLSDCLDIDGSKWDSPEDTARYIGMMAAPHIARLERAKLDGRVHIGSLYLRMRAENGKNVQRAEIAFGDVLGCLRTPKGGASRPRIVYVNGAAIHTRLVTPREAANLMGLPKSYKLPETYSQAYKVLGDGVVVPLVKYLAEQLLEPLVLNSVEKVEPPHSLSQSRAKLMA